VFDADVLFFTAPYLTEWLDEHGFEVIGDRGLLCRHELPTAESPGEEQALFNKLVVLESAMAERSPFKDTARYLHLIARRR